MPNLTDNSSISKMTSGSTVEPTNTNLIVHSQEGSVTNSHTNGDHVTDSNNTFNDQNKNEALQRSTQKFGMDGDESLRSKRYLAAEEKFIKEHIKERSITREWLDSQRAVQAAQKLAEEQLKQFEINRKFNKQFSSRVLKNSHLINSKNIDITSQSGDLCSDSTRALVQL